MDLEDVWFAYPSRPNHMVLKVNIFLRVLSRFYIYKVRLSLERPDKINVGIFQGITLKLQPSSKLALVGPSGGGKVIRLTLESRLVSMLVNILITKSISVLEKCSSFSSFMADNNSKLDREVL